MGNIYKLKCENGDYEKSLFLGAGMRYPGFNGSYKAAFCRKCNDFTEIMVNHDKNDEPVGGTKCCGVQEDFVRIDIEDTENEELTCPICGGRILVNTDGSWD